MAAHGGGAGVAGHPRKLNRLTGSPIAFVLFYETGFVDRQNVAIDYSWAEGHYEVA